MKRKRYRKSEEEQLQHERAVKLRKMTDEQLCRHIDESYKSGYEEAAKEVKGPGVQEYLSTIKADKVAGIGAVTINKLIKVAKENGYI